MKIQAKDIIRYSSELTTKDLGGHLCGFAMLSKRTKLLTKKSPDITFT